MASLHFSLRLLRSNSAITAWIGRSTVKTENPRRVYFITSLQNGKIVNFKRNTDNFLTLSQRPCRVSRSTRLTGSREKMLSRMTRSWTSVRRRTLATSTKLRAVVTTTIHLFVFKAITNDVIMRFGFRSFQELNGPRDKHEAKYPVVVKLHEPIKARYIRFIPTSAQNPRVMRAELYGCMAEPLPPYNGKLIV